MSLQELEKLTIKLASEIKEDRIMCLVEDVRYKRDKYLRPVVQLFVHCSGYGKVVLNYSPQKTRLLIETFKRLGIEDVIVGRCFEFEKTKVERMREDYTEPYPAWLPTRKIDCNYII